MGLTKSTILPPFDIDAQNFFYATGITNFNQKRAVNYLVKGFKQYNLWSKMKAVYPMVGGTANTCKFNLVNPIDSDLAFRLTYVNSPTITLSGIDWNGTTQYADTHLFPSTSIASVASTHLAYYSRDATEQASSNNYDMGALNTAQTNVMILCCGRPGGNARFYWQGSEYVLSTSSPATETGLFIGTRVAAGSTNIKMYRNGVDTAGTPGSLASSVLPAFSVFIGAANSNGSPLGLSYTNRQCAFASIGSGLTATEAFIMNSIVQQFQMILQRSV